MSSPSPNGRHKERDRKVAPGIYRTHYGWRLFVRVKGILRPKRITDPFHHLGLVELKQRREDWRTDARRQLGEPPQADTATKPGGFADEARKKYLPAVRSMPTYKQRVRDIELWIAEFGDRPRSSIKAWEVAQVRDRWLTEGPRMVCRKLTPEERAANPKRTTGVWVAKREPLSASQVNNRLRALENLWTVLDGLHAPNPVREAGEATEPETLPRAIRYDVITAILAQMPDRGPGRRGQKRSKTSLTKLRLKAMAYTGFSHGELAGLAADDLHLNDTPAWVWVSGRRKGQGTLGAAQPLTRQGAAALRALANAGGLGPFSPDSMRKSFARACAKLNLTGLRPYDCRHSFATEILEKTGGNIGATQLAMRHKDPRTTLRYAKGAIDPVRFATIQEVQAKGAFKSTPARRRGRHR